MREDHDTEVSAPKATVNSDTKSAKAKWKPVLLPLDPNFLRLNADRNDEYCDEFAVMLQNEEFLAELRFELFKILFIIHQLTFTY